MPAYGPQVARNYVGCKTSSRYCGNPTPVVGEEPRQWLEQRPLHGQVVNGRYYPFSAVVLKRSSSRQSGGNQAVLRAGHAADRERPEWGRDANEKEG